LSHPLAFANQSIYHGRILLAGWRQAGAEPAEPAEQIALAYAPAVRKQFLDAYGWLLLAACRITQVPEKPPHSVEDLPALPAGLVRPAEVDACALLENDGWVSALKRPITRASLSNRPGQLASDVSGIEIRHFEAWLEQMENLAQLIADAIDES
jgi:hypothetical protein